MRYKTVIAEVEVDISIEEFETEDLVEELKSRGAETERWVVTVFFDREPSRVYGLFDSEEAAMAWAESNRDGWDAMAVQQLREIEND